MGVRQKLGDGGRLVCEPVYRRRSHVPALVGIAGTLLVAGCTTSGGATPSSSPTASSSTSVVSATPTTLATPTVDPRTEPALQAVRGMYAASIQALMRPVPLGTDLPKAADFTKYSYDPIRGELARLIYSLASTGRQFRGTAPTARLTVQSIEPTAKPYPRVIVSNCPTQDPSWRLYVVKTGKPVPTPTGVAPQPYLVTYTVIDVGGRWGVSSSTIDSSRTCAP